MSENRNFFLLILLFLFSFIGNLIYNNSENLITVKLQPKYVLKTTEQNNIVETSNPVTEDAQQANVVTKTTEQSISVKNSDSVTEKALQAKEVTKTTEQSISVKNSDSVTEEALQANQLNKAFQLKILIQLQKKLYRQT